MKIELEEIAYDNNIVVREQSFETSDMTMITGKSGEGKTQILKQIARNYGFGYVSQDPDNQIVCDTVWHEMAFGLENIGLKSQKIRARVAEIATYLGIADWINKDVNKLSGGQKQKLCLASVLCMLPKVILLDEPTSMLDPISAREFFSVVDRLNRERNIQFLMVVHEDEQAKRLCNKFYRLENGSLYEYKKEQTEIISVKERNSEVLCEFNNLRKSYDSNLVINIPRLTLHKGINCFIGPNGVGKSTLLGMITGAGKEKRLYKDSVLMPQDVKIMFSKDTVRKELDRFTKNYPDYLLPLLDKHPYDLSGGQQHIVGVYMTLLRTARLYCFDEPTKGLDGDAKVQIMKMIQESGKDCIIVTHDLNLVAEYAEHVVFIFNRDIASEGTAKEVIGDNVFWKAEGVRFA